MRFWGCNWKDQTSRLPPGLLEENTPRKTSKLVRYCVFDIFLKNIPEHTTCGCCSRTKFCTILTFWAPYWDFRVSFRATSGARKPKLKEITLIWWCTLKKWNDLLPAGCTAPPTPTYTDVLFVNVLKNVLEIYWIALWTRWAICWPLKIGQWQLWQKLQ